MAIFSAAATALVVGLKIGAVTAAGAVTVAGSALLGKIVVGAIATGLAMGTSKLLGLYKTPSAPRDPGTKIQVGPSTDNKVPKLYGRNFAGGIIVDAEIKNQNKTMAYCIVISEYAAGETWSINSIYRGDAKLVFNGATVTSTIDPNATTTTKVNGKMRCRVYAGNSESSSQIFPTTDPRPAYGGTTSSKTGQFVNWSSANTMQDLVFAVFEIDYDPQNDLVGLDAITFDINNSLHNPANVLLDYLQNPRYGAGVAANIIDTVSFTEWHDHCEQLVDYVTEANVSATHERYQIDGALSTFSPVKENIDKICQSSGAFFTYNAKQGKFGVVVNRAASNAELANAFVFSDDNITSRISITGAELYSLYNQIEIEYASLNQRDQTDVYFAEIGSSARNANEPDNKLDYRLFMVNSGPRVANLGNIDLRQSRFNTILEFTGDHTTMVVDVGDVVKVHIPLYEFDHKLFRVMRVTEQEGSDGVISVKFILLEYDQSVYDLVIKDDDTEPGNTNISGFFDVNGTALPVVGNIFVADRPLSGANVNLYDSVTGNLVSNAFTIDNVIALSNSNLGNTNPLVAFPILLPANVTFDTIEVSADVRASDGVFVEQLKPTLGTGSFTPNSLFWFSKSLRDFSSLGSDVISFNVAFFDSKSGVTSDVVETANVPFSVSDTIPSQQISTFAAGAQLSVSGLTGLVLGNSNVAAPIVAAQVYNIAGIFPDTYKLSATGMPQGEYDGSNVFQLGFGVRANVLFANSTANSHFVYDSTLVQVNTSTYVPFMIDVNHIDINPITLGNANVAVDMLPVSVSLYVDGYNTLGNANIARQFNNISIEMIKIVKSTRL